MADRVRQETELTVAMILFIALTITGVAFGGFIVRDFACARASESWSQVEAVVLSSESDRFRYAYVADGSTHESSRVAFVTTGFSLRPKFEADPGDRVKARADPADASQSVILTGGSGHVFSAYAAPASLCVFIGVGGLIRTLIISREQEKSGEPLRLLTDASA